MAEQARKPHPIETLQLSRAERLVKALTSYYAIALAAALMAAGIFAWLAEEVLEQDFVRINTAILLWIHGFTNPTLTSIAFAFTNLGSVVGIIIIGALIILAMWLAKRYVDLATLAAVLTGGATMVFVLKLIFHQVRPHVFEPLQIEKNFSFPSGHSLMSFSLWGFLAWWIIEMKPREIWRWFAAAVCLFIAGMVALSRLYLGVHWPTDVLGGMLVAFAWIGICVVGQRWLTRNARRQRRLQDAQKARAQAAS